MAIELRKTSIGIVGDVPNKEKEILEKIFDAEGAQRESQLRYETLVQSIDGIVWEADPQTFMFTFVSKQAERILGYPLERWFEGPGFWPDHMHPDDRDWAVRFCIDATARGEDHQFEYRMIAADGRVVWLNDIVSLDTAADQSVILRGLMVDITKRKQAEDVLRRSEDHLRLVIDTIPTMAWSLRPDGVLDFVNQRWLDYTGLSFEDAIEEPTRTVHPEDLSRVMERWLVVKPTSESYEDEMRLQRADGEYRWFLVRIAPLVDEQGNLVKRYGVAIDIEERKRAEETLQYSETQLAEAQRLAHVGSFEWDIRSNAVTWSDELYRIFGLQPGAIKVAGDANSFIHLEDRDSVSNTVMSAVKNKEPYSFYYRIVRPDGAERIVHSRGHIVSEEAGDPIRVFGATQDVTELKRSEEKLKATSEQLRALSASLQSAREEEGARIARELHDELGSALTSLRWSLDEIDSLLSTSATIGETAILREKIATMTTLVAGTLETVRRISQELRPGILDEVGLIAAVEWEARQFEARTGIVSYFDSLVESVHLTKEQSTALFRIFQETLTNILRHAKASRVDITAAQEEGEFVLTIRDNGRGIADEEQSAAKSLGLLGMRERAHLMGGDVNITGVEGQGTVVTVRVRLFQPSKNDALKSR
jgi:PAS domain S-box-containing protein